MAIVLRVITFFIYLFIFNHRELNFVEGKEPTMEMIIRGSRFEGEGCFVSSGRAREGRMRSIFDG